jgi:hypothetical protein
MLSFLSRAVSAHLRRFFRQKDFFPSTGTDARRRPDMPRVVSAKILDAASATSIAADEGDP